MKKEYSRAIQSNILQLILETKEKYIESQKSIRELAEQNIITNVNKTLNNNAQTTFYAVKNNSGRRIQCPEEYKQTVKNYYQNLFQPREIHPDYWETQIRNDINEFNNNLNYETADINKEITKTEVSEAIKSQQSPRTRWHT